ncbi:hypothetical protein H6G04_08570 [Calothrix membranacea FACHB-236]|nr:hypothetical protein [Calothrix membranacea FACHB-236]
MVLEDIDYCWRIQQTGAKLVYVPEALVHFRYRDTIAGLYNRWWTLSVHDILLHKKHRRMGMPQLIKWQPILKEFVLLPLKFLVKVRNKETLGKWLIDFARLTGQLRGCIKYKYLPM